MSSAAIAVRDEPAAGACEARGAPSRPRPTRSATQVKTGRTHLMDALPITVGQEMRAWQSQVAGRGRTHRRRSFKAAPARARRDGSRHRRQCASRVREARDCAAWPRAPGIEFVGAPDRFASLAAQDTAVELSGALRGAAVVLLKISNDLRWMNSGPLAGLAEIALPALQPGSSIMPAKVNPVIPEAVAMAATPVMAHDAAVGMAGASGNFQLNVMLPLIADAAAREHRRCSQTRRTRSPSARSPGITVNAAQDLRVARAQSHAAHRACASHRLRPRGGDREACSRGIAADPRHRGRGDGTSARRARPACSILPGLHAAKFQDK